MTTMLELLNSAPWADDALCAQTDPEAFFPEKGGSTREAKAVCQSCEVREPCLQAALDADERFGVWGGLSERERRKVKHIAQPAAELVPCADCTRTFPTTRALATHRGHAHKTPDKAPLVLVTTSTTRPKEAPAMTQPQETSQPSYVDQIIAVMAATEGHVNPAVRTARKTVANALVALNKTLRAVDGTPVVAAPTVIKPKAPKATTTGGHGRVNNAQLIGQRVAALGVTSLDIRQWALEQGLVDKIARGALPTRLVDAYEQAHPQEVAS